MLGIKKENKNIYLRRLIFALIILAAAMLQNTNGLFPEIFGARALLIIPAVVCIAMFERDVSGLFFGLFAGALWDMCAATSWGFNAIAITIFAFASGALIKYIMRNNLVTALLLSTTSVVLYCLFDWLIKYVFKGYSTFLNVLLTFYLPTVAYTILFLPIFYFSVRLISKKFR